MFHTIFCAICFSLNDYIAEFASFFLGVETFSTVKLVWLIKMDLRFTAGPKSKCFGCYSGKPLQLV